METLHHYLRSVHRVLVGPRPGWTAARERPEDLDGEETADVGRNNVGQWVPPAFTETHRGRLSSQITPSVFQSFPIRLPPRETMRALLLICMPVLLLAQEQYLDPFTYPEHYDDYLPVGPNFESPAPLPGTYQQQVQLDPLVRPEKPVSEFETEPTEPGPLDCREEQYPCTRLYSVHKPCKQCLNSLCFYSVRRMYVINKEICVRTVCAHEELLRADLCRDQFSRCGVMALSGQCASLAGSCGKSCGGC